MKNILFNNNSHLLLVDDIFNTVVNNVDLNGKNDFDSDSIRSMAKKFYKTNSTFINNNLDNIIKDISTFSFYENENWIISDTTNSNDSIKLLLSLDTFLLDLLNFIETKGKEPKKFDFSIFGSLSLKASPDVEAYEPIGNNKLKINPSNRSYGLLYE